MMYSFSALRTKLCRPTLRAQILTLCAVGLLVPMSMLEARPTGPSNTDRRIALAVSRLMQAQHLSRRSLDDEMSRRCMKTFLKSLDPKKLFFYQSDVDEFLASQNRLDDLFKRGDIQFAHTVFARFLDRIEERMETAQAMLYQ